MNKYTIDQNDTFLLMVDIQERLFAAMKEEVREQITKNCRILLSAAGEFEIPVIISEQYRKGLGLTIEPLRELSEGAVNLEKIYFDCTKEEELGGEIRGQVRRTAVICGIESHICVLQTALSLLDEGFQVVVASDAVASRRKDDWKRALKILDKAGALVYPTETIAFMLLEKAGTKEFKALSPLFK